MRILITAFLGLLSLSAVLLAAGCGGDDRPQVEPSPAVAAQADAPAQQEQPAAAEPTSDTAQQQTGATTDEQRAATAGARAGGAAQPQVQQAAQEQVQQQAQPQTEAVADRAPIQLGGDRPATLLLPGDISAPIPLVMLLHGYTMSAESIDRFFGISARVETIASP